MTTSSTLVIKKAVIAAAGHGTRFLPQTKVIPKEMMPIIDKPVIQYIVEELAEAGIEQVAIVIGPHKQAILDHFDFVDSTLKKKLEPFGKGHLLNDLEALGKKVKICFITQTGRYGSATPVLNAQNFIGNEPFIYTYADNLILAQPNRFRQLMGEYQKLGKGAVLTAVKRSKPMDYKNYGYVGGKKISKSLILVKTIIEKPGSRKIAPSDLASVSSYLFEPNIFAYLEAMPKDAPANEELNLQPAIQAMINDGYPVYAHEVQNAKFYDTGNKIEYTKTIIDFSLRHPETKKEIAKYLRDIKL